MENLCDKCPPQVKGLCCHIAIPIEGYNIILDNVPCPYLDLETKKCTDYENRLQHSWCLPDEDMRDVGGLPEGCLYAKSEKHPKIRIDKLLNSLTLEQLHPIVAHFNMYNNVDFMDYVQYTIKNKEAKT